MAPSLDAADCSLIMSMLQEGLLNPTHSLCSSVQLSRSRANPSVAQPLMAAIVGKLPPLCNRATVLRGFVKG